MLKWKIISPQAFTKGKKKTLLRYMVVFILLKFFGKNVKAADEDGVRFKMLAKRPMHK